MNIKSIFVAFLLSLSAAGVVTAGLPSLAPGMWTQAPADRKLPVNVFVFPLSNNAALMVAASDENIRVGMWLDGKMLPDGEVKRVVSWDDMGRLSDELVFDPASFTWAKLIAFFNDNETFSVNWGETGHIDNISTQAGATMALSPYAVPYEKLKLAY